MSFVAVSRESEELRERIRSLARRRKDVSLSRKDEEERKKNVDPPQVPDPKLKYAQLLAYGKKLDPLPAGAATEANKVRGCVSQVWVVPVLDRETGLVTWLADSDSALTMGLAALLARGLSGVRPSVVAAMSPDFITELGLAQSLTPSRNNGFLNMFLTMQKLSVNLMGQEAEALGGDGGDDDDGFSLPSPFSSSSLPSPPPSSAPQTEEELQKPVRAMMKRKLSLAFSIPANSLEIIDESSQHAGHAGAKGVSSPSGETHFRIRVVSDSFEGLKTIERHRLVYVVLEEELLGPVHALSLETLTPEEDAKRRK
jgi:sulfur transfer protein SufE/stress-induced morphogen